jgi:hypothetical protein
VIILDTNVLSELMRASVDASVAAWVDGEAAAELFTTSVSKAEIVAGLAVLPAGRRRSGLATAAEVMFGRLFAGKILPFDYVAANHYGGIMAARRAAGRPISIFDAQIAAIALAAGADVATRDASGFGGCGLRVINPWAGP